MDFFTISDFDFYAEVRGRKFEKGNEFENVRRKLSAGGVFSKTWYWADLIGESGFPVDYKRHWQSSGYVRTYSWARIYLPGYEESLIYFTVGVGSRLSDNVYSLEYKLDCHRKDLSNRQIQIFDDFLNEQLGSYPWRFIESGRIDQYNWESLVDETLTFIEAHEDYYKSCVNLIWPQGIKVAPKIARLCWNTARWTKPSGPFGKSASAAEAFEKNKGYGYEEWLFDLEKQLDGYHYGFIQAFNKGNHRGETYDVLLYAIFNDIDSKETKYYWIAHLPNLEALTEDQMGEVLSAYRENGWYYEMLSQLNEVGIEKFDFGPIPENYIFNVRFKAKPGFFTIYDPPIEISNPEKEVGKNRHYVLLDRPMGSLAENIPIGLYRFREGHNPTKKGGTSVSYKGTTGQKILFHEEIKENIFHQLCEESKDSSIKVGTEVETGFGKSIDLVVHDPENGDTFYEIKTAPNGLSCIREAMGQIIEYCYFPQKQNASKLVIVSPNQLTEHEQHYMEHLRTQFGIELYYQRYDKQKGVLEKTIY